MLLQKRHSVVKTFRFCLTRRINLNSLSTQQGWKEVGLVRFSRDAALIVAAVTVGLAGCAMMGAQTPEEAAGKRSQERWDALVKGEFSAAYGYLSPAAKQLTNEKDYAARFRKGFWKSAKVDKVECASADACDALLTIEYEFQGRRTKTPLRESWVREGSNWWYVQK
jgi:hypothetical protein